ncbi:hypothetical protein KY285_020668 [Solanum tuberosum]|nr:hypothetical protein KY285_020668 [Solanum tuberosum]
MYGGSGNTIFSDEKFGGRFECAVGRLKGKGRLTMVDLWMMTTDLMEKNKVVYLKKRMAENREKEKELWVVWMVGMVKWLWEHP